MSSISNSNQSSVESSIHALAQDLLSRDPTRFNSCINHNFESQSTYKGHGLLLHGVSNIKHAATLFNTLDGGRAAVVDRKDVSWDSESTTATIHSTRFLRPVFSPVTFSLPVKAVLKFNSEDVPDVDGSNTKASKIPGESLFVTSFEEEWPLEGLVRKIPIVRNLFKALWVPIFTFFILSLANLVFAIQSRFTTQLHSPKAHDLTRKATKLLGPAAKKGFQTGKNETQKVVQTTYSTGSKIFGPPLRLIEWSLQRSTSVVNSFLPSGLIQLPWPSIFEENSVQPQAQLKESKKENKKEKKTPLSFGSTFKKAEESAALVSSKKEDPVVKVEEQNVPPAQDTPTGSAPEGSHEIPSSHATVLVGPSLDGLDSGRDFSIPEAQSHPDGAQAHVIGKEKKGKDSGSLKGKGSKGSIKERPKTLFDRIEMPKPSAEASISSGNLNVEENKSSSSNSSETVTLNSNSPTTTSSSATSNNSPALAQTSKTLEKSLEKEKETDGLEDKEESDEVHPNDPSTANSAASNNKGSQKKKNHKKKKSGRGGKAGGATSQAQA